MTGISTQAALLLLALGVGLSPAAAQDLPLHLIGSPGAITATGTAEIKRPAQRMRLTIDLLARDSDVRKAGKALQARIETVKSELAALGVVADSIEVGTTRIETAQTDSHQQMRHMMMERLGRGGKQKDQPAALAVITVTASLQADWELDSPDPIETLAKVYEIQQTIREAKLSGAEEKPELSAEDQELFEESQIFVDESSGEARPGEPAFLFLTKISPAEREAALTEAFSKATDSARQLASAAGTKLGDLQSLQETTTSGADDDEYGYSYGSHMYRAVQHANRMSSGADQDDQYAFGMDPGLLKYSVHVTAAYALGR